MLDAIGKTSHRIDEIAESIESQNSQVGDRRDVQGSIGREQLFRRAVEPSFARIDKDIQKIARGAVVTQDLRPAARTDHVQVAVGSEGWIMRIVQTAGARLHEIFAEGAAKSVKALDRFVVLVGGQEILDLSRPRFPAERASVAVDDRHAAIGAFDKLLKSVDSPAASERTVDRVDVQYLVPKHGRTADETRAGESPQADLHLLGVNPGRFVAQVNLQGAVKRTGTGRNRKEVLSAAQPELARIVESVTDDLHAIDDDRRPGHDLQRFGNRKDPGRIDVVVIEMKDRPRISAERIVGECQTPLLTQRLIADQIVGFDQGTA